ncbi:hypothetical protein [Variovorax defluvii]|uniref:hypothetical protein n=1 Tax=Variovorax defluvii TaxID=913761 RepID=UPI0031E9E338
MLRSREHLRRAIRALGHAPLVFNDIEELLPLREGLPRCAAVCLGLPHYPADLQAWVRAARNVVTSGVPMLFLTRENPLKAPGSLRCAEGDLVLAAPTCFADVHNGLQAFFTQHAIPCGSTGLAWGGYRFVPSRESVVFDDIEIHLRPLDFELALEFFHNTNRVLSRDWLRSMAAGVVPEAGGRWLDASVARLRTQLGLATFEGCEWQLSSIRYGGFKLSRTHGRKTAQPVAMPESMPQREPYSALSG